MMELKFYSEDIDMVLKALRSSCKGLTAAEADRRLAVNGKNRLKAGKKVSLLKKFCMQIADPMIIILLAAAAISGALAVMEGEGFADVIIILSVVGAFSINNNLMDVYWMLAFGVLGYIMKLYHLPVAPTILGIILVDLIELNFRRAAVTVGNSIPALLADLVSHPISLVLLVVIVAMCLSSSGVFQKIRAKASSGARAKGSKA